MSNFPSISDIMAEFRAEFVAEDATLSMIALAAYEYVITLDHEYRFLFEYKWSSATVLFLANRYLMLVASIIPVIPLSSQACYNISIERLFSALGLLPSVVSAVFSALRVYALLNRGYVTAAVVFLLGIVPVVTNIYGDQNLIYVFVDDPIFGASCGFESFVGPSVNLYLSYATRLSLIAADLVVVFVTWYKTFHDVKRASSLGFRGLSTVMFRDGSMYFVVLLVLNLLQLLLDVVPSFGALAPVSNLVQVVPSVLISRFLIHLRQSATSSEDASAETHSVASVSAPNFRVPTSTRERMVGPMGEYLDYVEEQDIRSFDTGSGKYNNGEAASAGVRAGEYQTQRTTISHSSVEEVNRDSFYAGETHASRGEV